MFTKIKFSLFYFSVLMLAHNFAVCSDALVQAYDLFQKRDQGLSHTSKAKQQYLQILKDSHASLEIRREALARYARLGIFEAELASESFGVSNSDAVKILENCIEVTELLSPQAIHVETPEYVYWRATCMGLWASKVSKFTVLRNRDRVSEIQNLIAIGRTKFFEYDERGFNRLLAGVYYRSKALKLLNQYHPDKAVDLLDKALENGTNIYIGYVLKAEALVANKEKSKARKVLESARADLSKRLHENTIPSDWIPENQIFLGRMDHMLKKL